MPFQGARLLIAENVGPTDPEVGEAANILGGLVQQGEGRDQQAAARRDEGQKLMFHGESP